MSKSQMTLKFRIWSILISLSYDIISTIILSTITSKLKGAFGKNYQFHDFAQNGLFKLSSLNSINRFLY